MQFTFLFINVIYIIYVCMYVKEEFVQKLISKIFIIYNTYHYSRYQSKEFINLNYAILNCKHKK